MKALELSLRNGEKVLINEDQVVSVHPPQDVGLLSGLTKVVMSNGDHYFIVSPPYDQWHNDLFTR